MPSPASTAAGEYTELVWTHLPTSWGVFLLLAAIAGLIYAVFALYRKEQPSCPTWVKSLLAALRAAAILLLAAIFLDPAIVKVQQRTVQPTLVILRDASQSMNTVDPSNVSRLAKLDLQSSATSWVPRARVIDELLSPRMKLLDRLAAKGRVELHDFADQLKPVELTEGNRAPPLTAEGRSTDLAGAIRQSLATKNPAAIIVLTDGQHTAQSAVEPAAREAAAQGVPLFFVGIGDPARQATARIASVYARPQAWQDEPFEIEAIVTLESMPAGDVRFDLVEKRAAVQDEPGSVVQSKTLPVPAGGSGQQTVSFNHTAGEPGEYVYAVRARASNASDDRLYDAALSNVVKVLSRERLRVLLVAGSPTWDYRLVQRLLSRDKTLTVSCWLQTLDEGRPQEGTRPITQLPATKEELFFYDVVLLLDPDPREFDSAWIDLLEQFVGEHAGGLLYMAGPKFTGRFLAEPRTAGLAALLPVTFGDLAAAQAAALLSSSTRAWPLHVMPAASDHPLLRFSGDRKESLRLWESLPGIFWSFSADAARPAAEVLLDHSDASLRGNQGNRPLLVAGRFGAGHTLYMGFTDTWRWRRIAGGELFDKFWIQTIRYLAEGRSLSGHRRGTLQADRERYELGDQITLRARVLDASYQPLDVPRLAAFVEVTDQAPQEISLLPVPNQPGTYEASLTARQTGLHRARLTLPEGSSDEISVETTFRVDQPSVETSQVWLNRPLLQELASLSGGRYFDLEDIGQLPAAIPDRTETVVSRSQPRPIWDTGGMLAVLVGLLCTEWFLRKRYKLL